MKKNLQIIAVMLILLGAFLAPFIISYRSYIKTPHENIYSSKMEINGRPIVMPSTSVAHMDPEDAFNP